MTKAVAGSTSVTSSRFPVTKVALLGSENSAMPFYWGQEQKEQQCKRALMDVLEMMVVPVYLHC